MRSKFISILTLALSIFFTITEVCAQSSIQLNPKFGNPTKEEMSISACPFDNNAKAMVLYSLTDVTYNYVGNTFKIDYTIKKRIKILDQEGTDEANISIVYYDPAQTGGSREMLKSIKATAYNMENGKMIKTKMGNDLIFNERLDKLHTLTKFTIPQVKAGTVIEYQYTKTSDFFYQIDDWYAQESIPTLYTSYDIEIPGIFVFNMEQTGANSLQYATENANKAFVTNEDPQQTMRYKFSGHNLPALKGDKFVWCPSMYANKISFELRSINIPGQYYKNFTTSWKDIDELLMNDDDFGGRIKRSNPLKDEMKAACLDTISNFKDKVVATYKLLHKYVKWNGSYALTGNTSHNVLKEGKASNADINFLLMNMLKTLNIKTVPLVMRTRNRGILPLSHPSLDALNTFVVGIYENDSTLHVMDGSAERGYLDVLPPVLLTGAHAIKGDNVNVMDYASAKQSIVLKGTLHSDGKLVGNISTKYYGIASLSKKKSFSTTKDSAEYVKDIAHDLNVNILKYKLKDVHKYSPETTELINFEHNLEMADITYWSPMLIKPFGDVPFTAEERNMPVEFDSPVTESYNCIIKIPEGYTAELPQPKILRSPDKQIIFRTQTQFADGYLSAMYTFIIKKPMFFQNEYLGLKNFFDDVYKELNNVVVLKKAQ